MIGGKSRAIATQCSERLRDDVFRARTRLKTYNRERKDQQHIFINDDLTPRRAKLSFDARALKRSKKISDCWTAYGKVMVKDLDNKVTEALSWNLFRLILMPACSNYNTMLIVHLKMGVCA